MNLYNISDQLIPVEHDFAFEFNRVIAGSCDHIAGSSDVYVWETGVYYMSYNTFHLEPLQTAIFLNNNIIVGSIIGDQLSATVAANTLILEITEEDLITPTELSPTGFAALLNLRNHSSYAPVIHIDGHQGSGSQINQTNINFVLIRISDLPLVS